jgi:hypothetical protein
MKTFDLEMLVDTVMDATESIIAETENVEDGFTGDMLEVIQFSDIRDSAEELQTLVLQNASIEQIENQSIDLYQNVKYILEHCENEIFSTTDTEVLNSFENMRTYVDVIRYTINTFVSESKVMNTIYFSRRHELKPGYYVIPFSCSDLMNS